MNFREGVDSSGVLLDVHVLGEGCAMKITRLFFLAEGLNL